MKFDDVKKLHQKKYRNEFEHYLVEGEHLVLELHKAVQNAHPKLNINITLYVSEEREAWAQGFNHSFQTVVLNDKKIAQLSDTKTPQGMVACVPFSLHKAVAEATKSTKSALTKAIYLYEVQDPGNLGTILRSLAWFGRFTLLLSPNSVDPFNPKVVRSAMGATFHLQVETELSLSALAERYASFAYLDMQGKSVESDSFAEHQCYLFGNEARGVPTDALQSMHAEAFTIGGSGAIDSLNLASAVTICAYQLSR
ncbi:RNA methyltransferase [Glaciecola sp. MH2013]|uniref:TrmH family RNA methyltransferase n=1 Tax=Glaciecola sp. MH2013 TaxID=2785524 RepID=UPI00189D0B36|nr:RNA methyltransferase [Glaciecola sp. MH2013]MBF7073202.1 RNA methyltransferase [Glaciecola sp. MH2013]